MAPNPLLGILLHAIGGFAAGSFYSPLKKIRNISWESAWLLMGLAAWLAAPWIAAFLTTKQLGAVLSESFTGQSSAIGLAILFGFLWGFGNLTYGMSARYLGIALGGSVALAFCMIFGTLAPPIAQHKAYLLWTTSSGRAVLAGITLCAFGIALCGLAGHRRELDLRTAPPDPSDEQFHFGKGIAVAVVAGLLSACFNFGLASGEPIADISVAKGTDPLFKNNAVLIWVLIGGFASNALSCLVMNVRNGTFGDYVNFSSEYARNLLLVWLAGITWFLQFFFYGMGQSKLGRQFEFSSWSIHMAFIVVFLNLWGLVFHEWRGTTLRTKALVLVGILILIASTMVIGYGNYLAPPATPEPVTAATPV